MTPRKPWPWPPGTVVAYAPTSFAFLQLSPDPQRSPQAAVPTATSNSREGPTALPEARASYNRVDAATAAGPGAREPRPLPGHRESRLPQLGLFQPQQAVP